MTQSLESRTTLGSPVVAPTSSWNPISFLKNKVFNKVGLSDGKKHLLKLQEEGLARRKQKLD